MYTNRHTTFTKALSAEVKMLPRSDIETIDQLTVP